MTVPRYSQGMDGNPDIDITGDEIATAEQRRLHRADQKRRLQVQVERALRALEAVPEVQEESQSFSFLPACRGGGP
jgi:hypothetical protein